MEFKKKRVICKIRNFTSIALALIMLTTSFVIRFLASYNGIMKNLTMANSMIKLDDENVDYTNEIEKKDSIENNNHTKEDSKVDEIVNELKKEDIIFENSISPDHIYSQDKDIDFSTKIDCTILPEVYNDKEYQVAITNDLIEVFANQYYILSDDEYTYTNITIPGKRNFYDSNEKLQFEKYNLKIKVLYKDTVSKKKFNEYEVLYDGEWQNDDISKEIDNVIAVRVELTGYNDYIKSFYINMQGKMNISNYKNNNSKSILSSNFIEILDEYGNSLIEDATQDDYSVKEMFEYDKNVYGKSQIRTSCSIKIEENIEDDSNNIDIQKNEILQENISYSNNNIKDEYCLEISKVDEEDNSKVLGAEFEIFNSNGKKIEQNISGIFDNIIVKNLKEDIYTIKEEIVPIGYQKVDEYILKIKNGKYSLIQNGKIIINNKEISQELDSKIELIIKNKKETGSININIVDEYLNNKQEKIFMEGIKLNLEDEDGNVLDTKTTDKLGNILFDKLKWNKKYRIKSEDELKGYQKLSEDIYLSRFNKDRNIMIKNIRKKGIVSLELEDKNTRK